MHGEWIRRSKSGTSVIFVHGILSSGEQCWKHKNGTYWPELLAETEEVQEIGIYVYTYQTNFFSGSYRLGDIVDSLKERMRLDGLFEMTSLIFVCHSMGGIVARKLLVERSADFIENDIFCGLFLLASPSLGATYANWLRQFAKLLNHKQADALRFTQDNAWLNDLDKEFQNLKESHKLKLFGKELIEDKPIILKGILRKQVVEPFSGARYFGEHLKVPGSDHSSIAKPANTESVQHRLLVRFISDQVHRSVEIGEDLATRVASRHATQGPAPGLEVTDLIVDSYRPDYTALLDFRVINRSGRSLTLSRIRFTVVQVEDILSLGALEYSATYDLDISELRDKGDIAEVTVSHVLKPDEADRLAVTLMARKMSMGLFRIWLLQPELVTSEGVVQAPQVRVGLPWDIHLSSQRPDK